jgi:hypothetical protein
MNRGNDALTIQFSERTAENGEKLTILTTEK